MDREKMIEKLRADGYNCCQTVLCACGDLTGLDRTTAASIGYGFGGGMYSGNVCGAVTGGLMAIGAAALPGDKPEETRRIAVKASMDFEHSFSEEMGSLLCREIIARHGKKVCEECIACGAKYAAETIEKVKKGEYDK